MFLTQLITLLLLYHILIFENLCWELILNICTILNYNIEKLSTSDFYSYFVTIKNIVGLKQTNGVEAQVAAVNYDFCDCGDVEPKKTI